jgi:competence protein ComEC
MVLGVQGGITDAIKNLFLNTGTLHVLVLSGYNITLVAGLLGAFFRNSRPQIKTAVMFVGIVFLVGVSGAGIAALRAGVMGSIGLLALLSRREYQPLRALAITYLIFFFGNPLSVFYDPSFHLSFLATFAIVALYPVLEARFVSAKQKWKKELQTLLLISVFMPLWMLPYSIYFSGVIGLSTPIANVVAALLVPSITVLGLLLLSVSWLAPLAGIVGSVVTLVSSLLLWLLAVCAYIPIWNAPPIPWWSAVVLYSIVIALFKQHEVATFIFQSRAHVDIASLQPSNQSIQENL